MNTKYMSRIINWYT